MADRPVVIVGFALASLKSLAEFQPDGSVIFVDEPDVVRKRDVRAKLAEGGVVRDLIEWEYQLPGAADEFVNRHRDLRPAAVVPLIEYATPFAARLAERYEVPGAGLGAAELLRDKHLLRKVTRAANVANPASRPVGHPDDVRAFMREHSGPVVLKPCNRQAAVGTAILHEACQVDDAWTACMEHDEGVFVPDRAMPLRMLVEEYLRGREYSVEMLVRDGVPLFRSVTDKMLYPGSRPVELGHIVPADISDELTGLLYGQTERVLAAVGFGTGVVHCEWIVADGVPYVVECAGRFPGDGIVELIERSYPVDLVRSYYTLMKGEPLPERLPERAVGAAAAWFLHVRPGEVEAVKGLDAARAVPGLVTCDISVHPGDRTHELRSSWDRIGLAIASADTPAQAAQRAQDAIGLIEVTVAANGSGP